jgi:hypothetical protein
MANRNLAYQAEQSFVVTALNSLATSPTAGWGSAVVDNTANLFLDAEVQVVLAAVNTVPGSSKALYVYAYAGSNATDLTTTGSSGGTVGTQGALTFPDITTLAVVMPLIGMVPYPVQNKLIVSSWFSVAKAFNNWLPPFWGVACVNHTGMILAASGNSIKYRGLFETIGP